MIKSLIIFTLCGVLIALMLHYTTSPKFINPSSPQVIRQILPKGWPEDGSHIFPEARRSPWINAINSAKKSIKLAAYKLSDQEIVDALCAAAERNVTVDILTEANFFTHEKSNNIILPALILKEAGAHLFHISDRFNQTHYKLILIDDTWGMLSTGNLDSESFDGIKTISEAPCRDFAITITNPALFKELERIFEADILDKRITPEHDQIALGPDNQRAVFLKMINSAKKSIRVYQQDLQDEGITKALAGAAQDGVKVEVIMMPYPFSKDKDNNIPDQEYIRSKGGKVHLHKRHYIHAKVLLVDAEDPENRILYIGSCNFYPASLDKNREMGILTKDPKHIEKILKTFEEDLLN